MKNGNSFKNIAIILTIFLIVLGVYTYSKYVDYHNDNNRPSYSDTEKFPSVKTEKTTASEELPSTDNSELGSVITEEDPEISFIWDYTQKWGYNCLSKEEKEVYAKLFDAAKEEKTTVNVTSSFVKGESVEKIAQAIENDNPQFLNFYKKIQYTYSATDANRYMRLIEIDYRKRTGGAELEAAAANIISQAERQADDYSKVKYIHDTIIENCSYLEHVNDENSFVYSAAGPLVYNKGVCEGYAKAFSYLVQSIGIPCFCVSGTAVNSIGQTDYHMWNVVQINGDWYNVDVTWDDPVTSTGKNVLRHDYFLIGDKIYSDHTPNTNIALPLTVNDFKATPHN